MKFDSLGSRWTRKPRPPLRTVSEIADMLGIPHQRLAWALTRDGAPACVMRGEEHGHYAAGARKVWYEPREVMRWYRDVVTPDDLAQERRIYHRNYYSGHYKAGSKA
jgi:hypothetical protein